MPRTVDRALRERILQDCIGAALRSGIPKLSLAELSNVTGVSRRMLIYHFGSVERLIGETLTGVKQHIREKLHRSLDRGPKKSGKPSLRRAILTLWKQSTSPAMEPTIRAYFHLFIEAMENRERYRDFIDLTVPGWIAWAKQELAGHVPPLTEPDLVLILAVLRGLELDHGATQDHARTTIALETFLRGYVFSAEKKHLNPKDRRQQHAGDGSQNTSRTRV